VLFKIGLPLLAAAFGLLLNGSFQLLDTVQKFLNLGVHGVSFIRHGQTLGDIVGRH
jgi:hypothetical protein